MRFLPLLLVLAACGPASSTGAGDPRDALTWNRDIRPIIDKRCSECHYSNGPGRVVLADAPELAGLMLQRIESGEMPPWLPSGKGIPLADERRVSPEEVVKLKAWLASSRLLGVNVVHAEPTRRLTLPERPDTVLRLDPPYHSQVAGDEVRCFMLPAVPGPADQTIYGYRWVLGAAPYLHHVNAIVIAAADVPKAQGVDAAHTGQGWPCEAWAPTPIGDMSNSSIGVDGGYQYPNGYGLPLPPGARIVLGVHYSRTARGVDDASGVELWIDRGRKPAKLSLAVVPSELPCPSGLSTDPSNPCSREYAITHALDPNARSLNDWAWSVCGQSVADLAKLPYTDQRPASWVIERRCRMPATPGRLLYVHPHMHTRALWMRASLCDSAGACRLIIDIPKWRPLDESAFTPLAPLVIAPGMFWEVEAAWDNGWARQWRLLPDGTSEPSYTGTAPEPREPPRYRIHDSAYSAEMCQMDYATGEM